MNQFSWLDAFNSAATFWVLVAIAAGIWFLVIKKDSKSKTTKR